MKTVKVPIFGAVYRNVDGIECNDTQELLIDGYLSEFGASVRRPGLSSWLDLGVGGSASVDGLYWWAQQQCVIAVCGGRIFKVTYPNSTPTATSHDATGLLTPRVKPTFATNGTYIFMATGGRIYYTGGNGPATVMADADAPTAVSSLGYLDGYLLASGTTSSRFYWADFNSVFNWTSTSYANAEANPDYNKHLLVREREILLFGSNTVEIWENDGATPFSRITGGFVETGCLSGASVLSTDAGVFWLNNNRRIVKWNGNSLSRVSSPYDKEIETFDQPANTVGYAIEIEGRLFLAWQFLSEARTIVCNYNKQVPDWSEWGSWNSENANYDRWPGACHCWCPDWGVHLVGSHNSDVIYSLSMDNHTDVGNPIRLLRRSGHIDYGTSRDKRCLGLRLRVKRGHAGTTSTPYLMVRWRDNNRYWSKTHLISLGEQGETDIIGRLFPGGIYQTRQYEFSCADPVPLTFLDAEEDIEVLR